MDENKRWRYIINLTIFLIGFASCFLSLYGLSVSNIDKPLGFGFTTDSVRAPQDWIKASQIQLNETAIIIQVNNATLSNYAPTGSMIPSLDFGANGIRIIPQSPEEINVGDIITYSSENIVHRVVEKGSDENGIWFIAKGDNNMVSDDSVIRFSDIKYITIGVLY